MLVLLGVCTLHLPGADVLTFNSVDVPVQIPEVFDPQNPTAGPADSNLVVSGMYTSVIKVTVSVYIVHEYTADLRLVLTAPDGTAVTLANGVGGDNQLFGLTRGYGIGVGAPPNGRVVFDDEAAVLISTEATTVNGAGNGTGQYIFSGTYRPQQNLAAFTALTPAQINGTWELLVDDELAADIGSIRAWSISFTIPGAHIWTGAGGNALWSTAANWQNNNVPVVTDINSVLIFPDNATNRTADNNLGDMRCSSIAVAGGYIITGDKITMIANSTFAAIGGTPSDTVLIQNGGIDLGGASTFTVDAGVTLNLNAVVANDLVAVGAPTFTGIGGTTLLAAANTYTGTTTISSGVVVVSQNASLGTPAAGTTVANGATLQMGAAITTTEPVSLAGLGVGGQGALATTLSATWGGPITLSGTNTGFGASAGTLTISTMAAHAAGNYGFTAIGPGSVTLGAALPIGTRLGTDGSLLTVNVAQPNLTGLTIADDGDINAGAVTLTVAGSVVVTNSTSAEISNGTVAFGAAGRSLSIAGGSQLTMNVTATGGGLTFIGAGTLVWPNVSTVPLGITGGGTLTGDGGLGDLSVSLGTVQPTGGFETGNLNLGRNSVLIYNGNSLNATGLVTLGNGVLLPFVQNGTVIANDGADGVAGQFLGMPDGSGVDYQSGGNDVALANLGGNTVSFNGSTTYTAAEGDGTINLNLTSSGAVTVVIGTSLGGAGRADFSVVATVVINGATAVPITINDDLIAEGTEVANLVIIPIANGFLANPATATLTITDNDASDQKTCGFGTGLTVFLLLGFGLMLHVRLRRP